jgi:hypothetical protein
MARDSALPQTVLETLQGFTGPEPMKRLFWSTLNYNRINDELPMTGWGSAAADPLHEPPLLLAGAGEGDEFRVIYTRLKSDKLLLGEERPVITHLLRDHPYALFLVSNKQQDRWHFVNVKYDDDVARRRVFRRITIGRDERLRTAAERIAMLDPASVSPDLFGLSPLQLQARHDEAFDVELVTDDFFGHYCKVFAVLQKLLRKCSKDKQWTHDYALQFLNRLMFLYFIQRKRWLGDDGDFLTSYWSAYKQSSETRDTFHERWLDVLFFQAFNEEFQAGRVDHKHLPEKFRNALATAPYLNGGLFKENRLDGHCRVTVPDSFFELLFDKYDGTKPGFLERYNFTISESTPFDVEVAVDPEMIGKVYEKLVNITSEGVSEEDLRGSAGIFYTPRVEIDLMCRLSLVDWLSNHLGEEHKPLLYDAVFAYDQQDKDKADEALAKGNLWGEMDRLLKEVAVCDPACGSGSFLVGMLMVLDDLLARSGRWQGTEETQYERRKRIVGRSLYGVDVMDWAVHVAELRLWLQLVVETELEPAELKFHPLLPNLTFKLRQGDSLVQEVGGINFGLHRTHLDLPAAVKGKLSELKGKKLRLYTGEDKNLTEEVIRHEEAKLFRETLEARAHGLDNRIKVIKKQIASPPEQMTLAGIRAREPRQLALAVAGWRAEVEELSDLLAQAREALVALKGAKGLPFVWDVAYVEVFEGDKAGFDVVIGNPPYVRHESIAPPGVSEGACSVDRWRELKQMHKGKLQASAALAQPKCFRGRLPGAKNDLYVYFYMHSLTLLNSCGVHCFIASNSWLDVGYGKDLQELVLSHYDLRVVMDNEVRRVFTNAEVNPAITLIGRRTCTGDESSSGCVRFVMFFVPYEQALAAAVFRAIESASVRTRSDQYRVHPMGHPDLLDEGRASEEALSGRPEYRGGIWGGRYLRAPDVFWLLYSRLQQAACRLSAVADVRRGVTSGANDFFHLSAAAAREWRVERKYLRPLVKSPRGYYSPRIPPSGDYLFWCHDEVRALRGTAALRYIKWGQKQGYDRVPSCRSRKLWYALSGPEEPTLLWPSSFFERHVVYECPAGHIADKVFYAISGGIPFGVRAFLNSTLVSLLVEVDGYQLNHGGIFVTKEWLASLPVIELQGADVQRVYNSIVSRDIGLCADELKLADRRQLDRLALRAAGVEDDGVLNELYDVVASRVAGRIEKARRSITKKGRVNDGTPGDCG